MMAPKSSTTEDVPFAPYDLVREFLIVLAVVYLVWSSFCAVAFLTGRAALTLRPWPRDPTELRSNEPDSLDGNSASRVTVPRITTERLGSIHRPNFVTEAVWSSHSR